MTTASPQSLRIRSAWHKAGEPEIQPVCDLCGKADFKPKRNPHLARKAIKQHQKGPACEGGKP